MSTVTLKDISLKEYDLNSFENLKVLRDRLIAAPVEICIERAKFITGYLKKNNQAGDCDAVYRAKAVQNYLINKASVFHDNSLLAGNTTSKGKGAPVYPEFIGLTIWSELETISKREKNPQLLTKEELDILNYEIYPYWIDRDVLATAKSWYGNIKSIQLLEKIMFYVSGKAGCISHTVPDFKRVLKEGLNAVIKEAEEKEKEALTGSGQEAVKHAEFYQSVQIALKGLIIYSSHLAEEARRLSASCTDEKERKRLIRLAEICGQVPAKPARSFYEAVQCIWICLIGIHAESINMAISPGRLDQILYPYYEKDMKDGKLTIKEALEITGCLWLKLGDNVDVVPQASEELFGGAGTAPAVTVGGIDEAGEDAVNDLTYIMLRVTELLKTREPSMNARFHYEKNTREYRDRVCEVIASTLSAPALYNDIENISTLVNQGTRTEHARDYAVIGCVELAAAGRSYDASSSVIMNLAAPLEMALYNGRRYSTGATQWGPQTGEPAAFKDFNEFMNAYKKQAKWLIEQAIDLNERFGAVHQKMLPTPLLSALFEGPMEKGADLIFGGAVYNSSGATHVGFADTVDSLSAVECAVFNEKYCTFEELLNGIKTNFKDREALRQYLLKHTPKYGTDNIFAKKNAKEIISFLYEVYQSHTNYRGGKYRPAYWSMTNHAGQGKITYATPNGRKAYEAFASGITPVSGAAGSITECLNSVAALGSVNIPGGEALNIKFQCLTDKDIPHFGDYIEAYFRQGGQQIQFNIMSYEMLKEAKANPSKYPYLLVRVSGYSAYFNDLNETMQDELITRTQYSVNTGNAILYNK
ncbi:formate C-acetyltransferase [Ruminiclostridium sufflavum DSM 19573]|uniref:Formate C-acetyltransferase n=1 Tax=Ruminiclostridium sufflavum DSM 19573 TaxID=1121337 RepID=A0A318XKI6_9FIRM|nr:pyruvate formate lyase family protein [Ruminiclostridium sufflavum]PYG86883.1 formate C-acetyltransferase [Ruminiclostridium sufflavum DSM 19573]